MNHELLADQRFQSAVVEAARAAVGPGPGRCLPLALAVSECIKAMAGVTAEVVPGYAYTVSPKPSIDTSGETLSAGINAPIERVEALTGLPLPAGDSIPHAWTGVAEYTIDASCEPHVWHTGDDMPDGDVYQHQPIMLTPSYFDRQVEEWRGMLPKFEAKAVRLALPVVAAMLPRHDLPRLAERVVAYGDDLAQLVVTEWKRRASDNPIEARQPYISA
jgi:hypothetical protein